MNIRIELCFELPFLTKELMEEFLYSGKDKNKNIDKRTDLFATIMALYPHVSTDEISKRTGVSERVIKEIAVIFGIHKNKQFRSDINRRNGDHPKKRAAKECTTSREGDTEWPRRRYISEHGRGGRRK